MSIYMLGLAIGGTVLVVAAFALWNHCDQYLWSAPTYFSLPMDREEHVIELNSALRCFSYPTRELDADVPVVLDADVPVVLVLSRAPHAVQRSLMIGYPHIGFIFFDAVSNYEEGKKLAEWACALAAELPDARLLATDLFVPMVLEWMDKETNGSGDSRALRTALVDPQDRMGAIADLHPALTCAWAAWGKVQELEPPFNEPRYLFTRPRLFFPGTDHRYSVIEEAFVLTDVFPDLLPQKFAGGADADPSSGERSRTAS